MDELFGDASRDGEWAAVRLRVDGQRIVAADAPGLERELAGLTLLEAAAVPGDDARHRRARQRHRPSRRSAAPTRTARPSR